MVNRDTCGQVIAVLSEKIHSSHDIEELEALAVRSVVLFAREIGIIDTFFEASNRIVCQGSSKHLKIQRRSQPL